jgi:heme exporter protein D
MSALRQWFAMGGYAGFVWPAYAIAVIVLGGLAVHSWRRHRQSARLLAQQQHETGRGA